MNKRLPLILLLLLATSTACHAGDVDKDAVKNADDFLTAWKIREVPEGKKAMINASWAKDGNQYGDRELPEEYQDPRLPTLFEQEKLFESIVETDAPGVECYRRLIVAKIRYPSGDASPATDKFLLVSYKNKKTGAWKVMEIEFITDLDLERQIASDKGEIDGNKGSEAAGYYSDYAYWLLLDGRITAAKEALQAALDLDKQKHDPNFDQTECQNEIETINSICGK